MGNILLPGGSCRRRDAEFPMGPGGSWGIPGASQPSTPVRFPAGSPAPHTHTHGDPLPGGIPHGIRLGGALGGSLVRRCGGFAGVSLCVL